MLGPLSTANVRQNPRSHTFRFVWAICRVCTCMSIATYNLFNFAQGIWRYAPKPYGFIDYLYSSI